MLPTIIRSRRAGKRPGRGLLVPARPECLEARRLLTCTASGTYFGAPGGRLPHMITVTLANESPQDCTVNASQLKPGGSMVHVDFTGTIVGPAGIGISPGQPLIPHGAYIQLSADGGSLVSSQVSNFTDGGLVTDGMGTHRKLTFSVSIDLPAGEQTHTLDVLAGNTTVGPSTGDPPNPAHPITGLQVTVDTTAPTVATLGPVATPRTAPVSSVPVTLSDAIVPATFTTANLSLTRDGVAVPLNGTPVAVAPVGGSSTNFAIGGLDSLTAAPGNYQLTVGAGGIQDPAGNPGTGSRSINFRVTAAPVFEAPAITSEGSTAFAVGGAGTFTVIATGSPTPTLSVTGPLPSGVTFEPTTGILGGTPAAGTGGSYSLTFIASNGIGNPATQVFSLSVNEAPRITSDNAATFAVGSAGAFAVTTAGFPAPTLSVRGDLPAGVTLDPKTGVLAGTPAPRSFGTYKLTLTARNGNGVDAVQDFVLTVGRAVGGGPKVLSLGPVSSPRTGPISAVSVTLSKPTTPSTFTVQSLTLTRDGVEVPLGGSHVTEALVPGSSTQYVISGLDDLTRTPGHYVLKVSADGFLDQDGNPGAGARSIAFVVQAVAPPAITGMFRNRRIEITFGTALDPSRAGDLANYTILPILSRQRATRWAVHLVSASYDPVTRTVTLTTNRRLRPGQSFMILVDGTSPGGLADASGTDLGAVPPLILAGRRDRATRRPRPRSARPRPIAPAAVDALLASGLPLTAPRSRGSHRTV